MRKENVMTERDREEAYKLLHARGILALDLCLVQLEHGTTTTAPQSVIRGHLQAGNLERDITGYRLTPVGEMRAQAARPYRNLLTSLVASKGDDDEDDDNDDDDDTAESNRYTEDEIDEMTGDEAKKALKKYMKKK
jgi:hypothetical protein